MRTNTRMALLAAIALLCIGAQQAMAQGGFRLVYFEKFNQMRLNQDLNGQRGWSSLDDGNVVVANPPGNSNQIGALFSGRGPVFGFEQMAESPQFAEIPPNSGFSYVVRLQIGFENTRTSWYVTPKNVTSETVVSRVWFRAGGTVEVLVPLDGGGQGFVPVPDFTWEGGRIYELTMLIRGDGTLRMGVDNDEVLLYDGPAFIEGVEAVSFECGGERVGDQMFIDDLKILGKTS